MAFLIAWQFMLRTEGEGKTVSSIEVVSDTTSALSVCGDGLIEESEECDDGNDWDYDGCTRCLVDASYACVGEPSVCVKTSAGKTGCGNTRIEAGEMCDDGNGRDGDGCSYRCETEPGYVCDGPGTCRHRPPCGNGAIESGEECDDGNRTDYDGCNAACQTDHMYVCTGSPSVCTEQVPVPAEF